MRQRFESGHCGFCEIDPTVNTVLFENTHWIIWENAFGNDRPCKVMLVILSRKHLRMLGEISKAGWAAFHEVVRWAEAHYDLPGGMLFMRFGHMQLNAGTVPHLHWNLWVPDQTAELRVPIFKDPHAQEADRERARHFARRYEAETP
jgi:diadenosine tetraphosphate (Ap4A) HIT family hydrolase